MHSAFYYLHDAVVELLLTYIVMVTVVPSYVYIRLD